MGPIECHSGVLSANKSFSMHTKGGTQEEDTCKGMLMIPHVYA